MNRINRIVFLLMVLGVTIFISCSHIIDPIWNYNAATLTLDATTDRTGTIQVSWESSSLSATEPLYDDTYEIFWSYVIYRTEDNPFNEYEFLTELTNKNTDSYNDTNVIAGVEYYYRLVIISKKRTKKEEEDENGNKVVSYKISYNDYEKSGWAKGTAK